MARKSKIDRLPAEVKEAIGRLRRDGRTIDEILAKLRELDVDVSRSGLGRHIQGLDAIAAEIERSRGIAEALVDRFGDAPESRTARLNVELMHAQVTKLLVPDADGNVSMDAQGAYFLSTSLARLAQAAKFDTDREIKARERVAKETAEKAADAAAGAAKEGGLSEETVQLIRARILGMAK